MSIQSQAEFEKLRAIGRIVRKALDKTAAAVQPGITTGELDEIGAACWLCMEPNRRRRKFMAFLVRSASASTRKPFTEFQVRASSEPAIW